MIVLFLVICLVVLAGLAVLWASRLSGEVVVTLGPDTISVELVVAILGVILLGAIMAIVWAALAGLIKLPKRFTRARKNSRTRNANKSLADGLLAAEAGDVSAAREAAFKGPGKFWGVMRKAPRGGALHPLDERANRIIAMVGSTGMSESALKSELVDKYSFNQGDVDLLVASPTFRQLMGWV